MPKTVIGLLPIVAKARPSTRPIETLRSSTCAAVLAIDFAPRSADLPTSLSRLVAEVDDKTGGATLTCPVHLRVAPGRACFKSSRDSVLRRGEMT